MIMQSDVRCANIDLTGWGGVKTNIQTARGVNRASLTICTEQVSPPPPNGKTTPGGPVTLQCRGFTITLRHTTLGRIPLDE
jgi:hypothetical protein